MSCPQCGANVNPGDSFCGQCGSALPVDAPSAAPTAQDNPTDPKEALLRAVEAALSSYPQLTVTRSLKTDLEVKSRLADAQWPAGRRQVDYSARLLAKAPERTVVYWEMIKEVNLGMGIPGGFKAETKSTDTRTISGKVREAGWIPGGKVIDYDWDYARTRDLVRGAVEACGWRFTTTLLKGRAEHGNR